MSETNSTEVDPLTQEAHAVAAKQLAALKESLAPWQRDSALLGTQPKPRARDKKGFSKKGSMFGAAIFFILAGAFAKTYLSISAGVVFLLFLFWI